MSPLEQSIVRTLTYFDLVDYPLTKEELFSYLWRPPFGRYDDFLTALESGSQKWENKWGYYFLSGREHIVENRRVRLLPSEQKLRLARRAAKKIRSVPFLRAIFLCNSVASGTAGESSDIDFFIIADPKRIWLVRFFTNFILKLFGWRTYGQKIRNRICLSFYVDGGHLDISPLRAVPEDIHFIYWLYQMLPLYDPDNYNDKFLKANKWAGDYLPNLKKENLPISDSAFQNSRLGLIWKKIWEKMWSVGYGDLLESQAKGFQLAMMKKNIKSMADMGDNSVVIGDSVIKLHENDTRKEYYEKWKSRIN
ncbi:MAG: hypothetical protein COU29_00485 [Candidatus Magasanikbacteria bacterium CG10_big_fil_rev_8_21_14_0_10_36_32]|uniref:Polymerase nucleotidyl transferase domain-containing protein n=1 Tax=Candidatus Magasanikbacteria bacterium CG10_big_fil_rev_8_21_14_0_10_36_32 TaxID=1974646 RepID=A0A2M6W7F3_9BACT|nr:MAG: hypothetical protein COU29_00485 [Candidatus Magasanikbacteria bacterium CG10_big_fil_rev_8_21_14_0_10_36_32]